MGLCLLEENSEIETGAINDMRYLVFVILVLFSLPASAQQLFWVKLQISGTALKTDLTYNIGGVKRRKSGVALPWTEMTLGEKNNSVILTAQNRDSSGTVELKIYAKPISQAELDTYNYGMIRVSSQLDSLKAASSPGNASYDKRYDEIQRADSLRLVRENKDLVLLTSTSNDSTHGAVKATAVLK
jgi:hypothetical protein